MTHNSSEQYVDESRRLYWEETAKSKRYLAEVVRQEKLIAAKDKLIVESVNNAARYKEALENIGNNIFDSGQDSGQYMAEVARNALNIKED